MGYDGAELTVNSEAFRLQCAYLYALTIRGDTQVEVKSIIERIERKLSNLAGIKSAFDFEENTK